MKKLLTLLTCLFILSPNVVLGETVKPDDLVYRNGLFYKKFTSVPFSGKVTGVHQGSFKDGRRDGPWEDYHKDGQLWSTGIYKYGRRDRLWEYYHKNGHLYQKTHNKDGKLDGLWEEYHYNGRLEAKGHYKDGRRDGPWIMYHINGQLWLQENYKNGEWDGPWSAYYQDGVLSSELTGTYKDGEKVSD